MSQEIHSPHSQSEKLKIPLTSILEPSSKFITLFPFLDPLSQCIFLGKKSPQHFESLLLIYNIIYLLSITEENKKIKEVQYIYEKYLMNRMIGPKETWKNETITSMVVNAIDKGEIKTEELEDFLDVIMEGFPHVLKKDRLDVTFKSCVDFVANFLNDKMFGVQTYELEENSKIKLHCVTNQVMVDWILRTLILDDSKQDIVNQVIEYLVNADVLRPINVKNISLNYKDQTWYQVLYKPYHTNEPPFNYLRRSGRLNFFCDFSIEGCLLSSTYWKQEYVEFLSSEKCEENILFFDDVEKFRVNPSPTFAIKIYSKYISVASHFEVNLPSNVRKGIGIVIRGLLKRGYMHTKGFKEVLKQDEGQKINVENVLDILSSPDLPDPSILKMPEEIQLIQEDKHDKHKKKRKNLSKIGRSSSSYGAQHKIPKIQIPNTISLYQSTSIPALPRNDSDKNVKPNINSIKEEDENNVPANMFDMAQKTIMTMLVEDTFARFKKLSSNFELGTSLENWWNDCEQSKSVIILVFFDRYDDHYLDKYFLKAWGHLGDEIRSFEGDIFAISTMKQKDLNQLKIILDLNINVISDEESYLFNKFQIVNNERPTVIMYTKQEISMFKINEAQPNKYPDPTDIWHRYKLKIDASDVLLRKSSDNLRMGCPLTGHGWKNKNLGYYYRNPVQIRGTHVIVHNARIKKIKSGKKSSTDPVVAPSVQQKTILRGDRSKETKRNRSFTLSIKLKKSTSKGRTDKEISDLPSEFVFTSPQENDKKHIRKLSSPITPNNFFHEDSAKALKEEAKKSRSQTKEKTNKSKRLSTKEVSKIPEASPEGEVSEEMDWLSFIHGDNKGREGIIVESKQKPAKKSDKKKKEYVVPRRKRSSEIVPKIYNRRKSSVWEKIKRDTSDKQIKSSEAKESQNNNEVLSSEKKENVDKAIKKSGGAQKHGDKTPRKKVKEKQKLYQKKKSITGLMYVPEQQKTSQTPRPKSKSLVENRRRTNSEPPLYSSISFSSLSPPVTVTLTPKEIIN